MDKIDFAVGAIFQTRPIVAVVDTASDCVTYLRHENPAVPLGEAMCFTRSVREQMDLAQIYPDDMPLFDVLLDLELLRDACRKQKNGILFSFRRQVVGRTRWARVLLNVPEDYSEEKTEVLICLRYLSEREADDQDASRLVQATIRKVVKCDLEDGTVTILKEPRGEEKIHRRFQSETAEDGFWAEEECFVHPDDVEEFRNATRNKHVREWFLFGNTRKDVFYRRKTGALYHWVKLIIQPAAEYTQERPVFLYFVVDVQRTMTTQVPAQPNWEEQESGKAVKEDLDSFYSNIINVLSYFTQKYTDFYVVDMVKDRYITYKIDRELMAGNKPYVGCYSQMAEQFLSEAVAGELRQNLKIFASLEELRTILEEKVSFEYGFTLPDGKRYRTVCTRLESDHGVPTKMIARTFRMEGENRLRVKTFGSFEVYDGQGRPIVFTKKKSKQLLAYLVDKYGFPAATADIVTDVLEKEAGDKNATKYVSTLFRAAVKDLEAAGYSDIILKEWNSLRINADRLDCDYYHLMEGDTSYWAEYHNEYMKEYSWAEETNAEILQYGG